MLSPNALGAILNDQSIPRLHARVVAGGANNQLARDEHGAHAASDRGILYAPDYVINGGGIIRVAGQIENWSDAEIERRVLGIADTLTQIFHRADAEGCPPASSPTAWRDERIARGREPLRSKRPNKPDAWFSAAGACRRSAATARRCR